MLVSGVTQVRGAVVTLGAERISGVEGVGWGREAGEQRGGGGAGGRGGGGPLAVLRPRARDAARLAQQVAEGAELGSGARGGGGREAGAGLGLGLALLVVVDLPGDPHVHRVPLPGLLQHSQSESALTLYPG